MLHLYYLEPDLAIVLISLAKASIASLIPVCQLIVYLQQPHTRTILGGHIEYLPSSLAVLVGEGQELGHFLSRLAIRLIFLIYEDKKKNT